MFVFVIIIITITFSFGTKESHSQVTDYDGNVYKTVIIGNQEWTSENLNVEHYRNGDIIPQVQDWNTFFNLTTGAWCYYEHIWANGRSYGKLYNWYAVSDSRGLAPEGWHIPSEEEWKQLEDALGGYLLAGGKLKATTLWAKPNKGATNESGFTALPGGIRQAEGYPTMDYYGYFWSSSESNILFAWSRVLNSHDVSVFREAIFKYCGLSIRCVRD